MSEQAPPTTKKRVARKQSLALYDDDMERLEQLRQHYRLRSWSETTRWLIDTATLVMAHEQAQARRREAA